MPLTGTSTRVSAAITRPASKAPSVTPVLAATPPVAISLACGMPAPRRPATCPATIVIMLTHPAAPSRLVHWNKTRRRAPAVTSCTAARAAATTSSFVKPSRCRYVTAPAAVTNRSDTPTPPQLGTAGAAVAIAARGDLGLCRIIRARAGRAAGKPIFAARRSNQQTPTPVNPSAINPSGKVRDTHCARTRTRPRLINRIGEC